MRYRYCILSSFLLMKYPYNQYITCMNFMNVEVCWCMMMFRMVLSLVSSLLELESMAWYMNIKTQPINLLLVFQLSFTYLDSSQSLSKYSTISYIYLIYLTSYLVMQTLMLFMHYVYYYNRLNCYGCCYYWLYLFFIYANTAILVLIFTLVCVPYMFYFYLYFYIYNTISIIKIYRIYAFAYNTFTMLCTYYLNMWYFIIINQQQYPNYSPVCTYLYLYVRISNTRRLTQNTSIFRFFILFDFIFMCYILIYNPCKSLWQKSTKFCFFRWKIYFSYLFVYLQVPIKLEYVLCPIPQRMNLANPQSKYTHFPLYLLYPILSYFMSLCTILMLCIIFIPFNNYLYIAFLSYYPCVYPSSSPSHNYIANSMRSLKHTTSQPNMAFIVGPMPRMDATLQCMNQVNIQSIFQLSSPLSFSLTCWDLTAQLHCYSYILQMVAKLPEFNVYLQKSALFLCTFSILISNSKYPSLTENINEFQFFSEMNFLISETYLLVYFMPFFYSVRMSYYFEGDATLLILVVYYS